LEFKNEKEEFEFWIKADSTDYIDHRTARLGLFPNLKPTSKAIPLRLPVSLLDRLMIKAHKCGVPYQSLLKLLVIRGLRSL
jgi:predicted DNA binding CopG/RHH family protein